MKFEDLSAEEQERAKAEFAKHSEQEPFDPNNATVEKDASTGTVTITYKDITVALPIGKPSQETTNGLWYCFAGCVMTLIGVLTGAYVAKDSDSNAKS